MFQFNNEEHLMKPEWVTIPTQDHHTVLHNVIYVHGVGISYRAYPVPFSDGDRYGEWINEVGGCEHSAEQPSIWMFTGIWPDTNDVFQMYTPDHHVAMSLMHNPKKLRVAYRSLPGGYRNPLVDDAWMAVGEFHNFYAHEVDESERIDYHVLRNVDPAIQSVEKALQKAAESPDQEETE